jgi:hypothetical protein
MPDATSELFWHFLPDDRRMQFRPHTLVEAGGTYLAEGSLLLCGNGLHASRYALDALRYAPGDVVCRVHLGMERQVSSDKLCARTRTVVWLADAHAVLHEFACRIAEQTLARYGPEDRLTAAIAAKRAWLAGTIDDLALDQARWDAYSAVRENGAPRDVALMASRAAGRTLGNAVAWATSRMTPLGRSTVAWAEMNVLLTDLLLTLAPADATSGRAPAGTPDTLAMTHATYGGTNA